MSLSPEQERALNLVLAGRNVFITGPGGTGKTHLIRRIVTELTARPGTEVIVTAMTGCAAVLLRDCGAKTIHSWGGIGLGDKALPEIIQQLRKMKPLAQRWRTVTTLILDEVSMLTGDMLRTIDTIARTLRRSPEPLGGIQFIAVGDFFQLPPVNEGGVTPTNADYAFESDIWWRLFPASRNYAILKQNFRQAEDMEFQKILNLVRFGNCTPEVDTYFQTLVERTRTGVVAAEGGGAAGGEGDDPTAMANLTIKPTRLFPLRGDANRVNREEIRQLENNRDMRTFRPETVTKDGISSGTAAVRKATDELDKQGSYERELRVCIGSQVMVTSNIDFERGLVNGAQGVIVGWWDGHPRVKFSNSHIHVIQPHTFPSDKFPGVSRKQYPLRLCWAATIHKMQGQTLDFVEVDVGSRVFEQGQTYVALSRARTSNKLRILEFSGENIKAHPRVIEFQNAITKS